MRTKTRSRPDRRGPLPAPLPTNKPTPERQRHAESVDLPDVNGAAFRPWWRITSRLGALLADDVISARAYDACEAIRRDYEQTGTVRGSPIARLGMGTGEIRKPDDAAMLRKLAALRRLRRVRERLGETDFMIVVRIAIDDTSWRTLAKEIGGGCRDVTMKRRAVEAINRLIE